MAGAEQPADALMGEGPDAPETDRLPLRIRVDLDPAIAGGFIHDRYDVQIRGRVVSSVPIEEAVLLLDGMAVGRVRYGPADQPRQTIQPDGTSAALYVFHFNLPLDRTDAHRLCTSVVAVHAVNGDIHEESFDIAVDPS